MPDCTVHIYIRSHGHVHEVMDVYGESWNVALQQEAGMLLPNVPVTFASTQQMLCQLATKCASTVCAHTSGQF